MKNDTNFCWFCIILKNSQVTFYRWIESFFCSLSNVGLTNFGRIFFGDSQGQGSTLHQILPPPSSLTRNPVKYLWSTLHVLFWRFFGLLPLLYFKIKTRILKKLHLCPFWEAKDNICFVSCRLKYCCLSPKKIFVLFSRTI